MQGTGYPGTHDSSSGADAHFRQLRLWDRICYALLGLMVLVAIWNVLTLAGMARLSAPDLNAIPQIMQHPSSRIMFLLSAITIAAFGFKEWRYGERGMVMMVFLCGWLFFTLVPLMSAETQADWQEHVITLSHELCEPGGLGDGAVQDLRKCDPSPLAPATFYMAGEDPSSTDTELLTPHSTQGNAAVWNVHGRGRYTVYLVIPTESEQACTGSTWVLSHDHVFSSTVTCFMRGGEWYASMPMVTDSNQQGIGQVYQQP